MRNEEWGMRNGEFLDRIDKIYRKWEMGAVSINCDPPARLWYRIATLRQGGDYIPRVRRGRCRVGRRRSIRRLHGCGRRNSGSVFRGLRRKRRRIFRKRDRILRGVVLRRGVRLLHMGGSKGNGDLDRSRVRMMTMTPMPPQGKMVATMKSEPGFRGRIFRRVCQLLRR